MRLSLSRNVPDVGVGELDLEMVAVLITAVEEEGDELVIIRGWWSRVCVWCSHISRVNICGLMKTAISRGGGNRRLLIRRKAPAE